MDRMVHGRFGGRTGNHSTPYILDTMHRSNFWKYFGVFGIFTHIGVRPTTATSKLDLSYVYHSLIGTFQGMSQQRADFLQLRGHRNEYYGIPYEPLYSIFFAWC